MPTTIDNKIPQRPDLLDRYLANRESTVGNIRPGCEKKIVWHRGKKEKAPYAIVYLHGFSASRKETWPLCDRLAAVLGANLFYTRLSGHGQDGPAMGEARVGDWLADGLEAVAIGQRIGRRVILVGTSTGGTLAAWLAAHDWAGPLIHGLILISPNFFPKNPMALAALWPPTLHLFEKTFGGWRNLTVKTASQARYWTTRYPIKAVTTMMRMVCLAWRVDLKRTRMPVLMLVNPWDRVINVTLARLRFRQFPSPQKQIFFFRGNKEIGLHVLAGELLSRATTDKALAVILTFMEKTYELYQNP